MKKIFTFLFALMLGVGTMLAETIEHVQIGDLYYNLDTEKQTAEVTYQERGSASNYSGLTTVTIFPSVEYTFVTYNVTSIGDWAFFNSPTLTSVTILDNVTNIGENAFCQCRILENVTMGSGIINIGREAFFNCVKLAHIGIPDGVISIGEGAFGCCYNLRNITIPNSITHIGLAAFSYNEMESMVVEEGNKIYDSRDNCNAIIETETNKLISGCKNTIIPKDVTSIGEYAFSNIYNLKYIEIPIGVKSIEEGAFVRVGLSRVTIPGSVVSFGRAVFYNCDALTDMIVEEGNPVYDSRDNCNAIIETATNSILFGCKNTKIPNSVTSIGREAFIECKSLVSITIPIGVKDIGERAFFGSGLTSIICGAIIPPTCGKEAFYDVDKSIPVYVPAESIEAYKAVSGWSEFTNIQTMSEIEPGVIASGTCGENLTWELSIDSVLTIRGEGEMENWNLYSAIYAPWHSYIQVIKKLVISEGVKSLGDYAFIDCSALESVTIASTITKIGLQAFLNCGHLEEVNISDLAAWCKVSFILGDSDANPLNDASHIYVNDGEVFDLVIPEGVTSICYRTFMSCPQLTSVSFPSTLRSFGNEVFSNCSGIKVITCHAVTPPSLAEDMMFMDVFEYVDKSIPVYVPAESVEAYKAAGGWKEFTNIQPIGEPEPCIIASGSCGDNLTWELSCDSVLTISGTGEMTSNPWLEYSSFIKVVNIQDGVTNICDNAFSIASNLTLVEIPNSITRIGNYAFADCSGLMSIEIPESVNSIGEGAFRYCENLTSITIPNGVTSLGNYAFLFCSSLTDIDVAADNSVYSSINGVLFNKNQDTIITYPGGKHGSYTIPNRVVHIYEAAFDGCEGLRSISIPNSVIGIGGFAFYYSGITSVTIPNSVQKIDYCAFHCCSELTEITIPGSITYIGFGAFDGCPSLSSVTCESVTPLTCVYEDMFHRGDGCTGTDLSTCILYVPASSVDAYRAAAEWSGFTNIQPIQAEEVPVTEIEAEPTENSVVIEWPKVDEATVYTIEIKKNGELICTLTFNELGQLQGIAFAKPTRNGGRNSQVRMAIQTATGWQYTISGLDPDTEYTYSVVAKKNASDTETLYSESISFTTKQTPTGVDEVSDQPSEVRKLLRNGQLYIFRDGKLFNAQGVRVK